MTGRGSHDRVALWYPKFGGNRTVSVEPTPRHAGAIIVLHIEDDPSVARSVARLLRLQGYEVVSAASGDDSIQLVEDGLVPDLILTDYQLPSGMTGDQVITEIETRLGFRPPTYHARQRSRIVRR